MTKTEPRTIEHSVEKAHIWLKEIPDELGVQDRITLWGRSPRLAVGCGRSACRRA
jgi:hypothetical protein